MSPLTRSLEQLRDDMRLIASLSTGEVEGIAKTLKNANERIERPEGLTVVVAKVVSVETAEAIVRQCLNLQNGHGQYRSEISELATAQSKQFAKSQRQLRSGIRADANPQTPPYLAATKIDERLVELLKRIDAAALPSELIEDADGEPNDLCRALSSQVVEDLYRAFGLRPNRIAASLIGGIMLAYRQDCFDMEIEVDNDGDVTGVVSDQSDVLETASIILPAELSRLVRNYRARVSAAS